MSDVYKLNLAAHDELYRIDINRVVYFQADDHYSYVYYNNELHVMLPFGLSVVEQAIDKEQQANCLVRLGRKYIVNTDRIMRVSSTQCKIYLYDEKGKTHSVTLSKPVIRDLMDAYIHPEEVAASVNPLRDSRK